MDHLPFDYNIKYRTFYPDDLNLEEMVDPSNEIKIEFDYPLRVRPRFTFKKEGGFSKSAFADAVSDGYERIYKEEDETKTVSAEPKGMILNRSTTDGTYGIWGHDLADLCS